MAAHEALGSQFFHGTDHAFQPGEKVLPPLQTGAEPKTLSRDDRVYLSTSHKEAAAYGKHVYEVQPHGPVDEGYWFPEHERLAESATVMRKI